MKARNTKTGKEITILGISKEWGTATYIEDGILCQRNLSGEWEIIDDSGPVDWPSFRREAAKDILCAMVSHTGGNADLERVIELTDALVAKLKQE